MEGLSGLWVRPDNLHCASDMLQIEKQTDFICYIFAQLNLATVVSQLSIMLPTYRVTATSGNKVQMFKLNKQLWAILSD